MIARLVVAAPATTSTSAELAPTILVGSPSMAYAAKDQALADVGAALIHVAPDRPALAGAVEVRDGLALGVEHAALLVTHGAAHGVGEGGLDLEGVVRALLGDGHQVLGQEAVVLVDAGGAEVVVALHGGHEGVSTKRWWPCRRKI